MGSGAARTDSEGQVSLFDVGECALHLAYNYRGVVVGRDAECLQNEAWIRSNGIDALKRGRKQPFYYVLADTRDRPGAPVNYVAHEHLIGDTPPEPLKHPLLDEYFSGFDSPSGRFVPTAALRSRYPLPPGKHDVVRTDAALPEATSDIEDID